MKKDSEQARVLSIADFATALGVKAPTIRCWLMQRKIARVKLGRRVLIPRTELERLLNENLIPALPDGERF